MARTTSACYRPPSAARPTPVCARKPINSILWGPCFPHFRISRKRPWRSHEHVQPAGAEAFRPLFRRAVPGRPERQPFQEHHGHHVRLQGGQRGRIRPADQPGGRTVHPALLPVLRGGRPNRGQVRQIPDHALHQGGRNRHHAARLRRVLHGIQSPSLRNPLPDGRAFRLLRARQVQHPAPAPQGRRIDDRQRPGGNGDLPGHPHRHPGGGPAGRPAGSPHHLRRHRKRGRAGLAPLPEDTGGAGRGARPQALLEPLHANGRAHAHHPQEAGPVQFHPRHLLVLVLRRHPADPAPQLHQAHAARRRRRGHHAAGHLLPLHRRRLHPLRQAVPRRNRTGTGSHRRAGPDRVLRRPGLHRLSARGRRP